MDTTVVVRRSRVVMEIKYKKLAHDPAEYDGIFSINLCVEETQYYDAHTIYYYNIPYYIRTNITADRYCKRL